MSRGDGLRVVRAVQVAEIVFEALDFLFSGERCSCGISEEDGLSGALGGEFAYDLIDGRKTLMGSLLCFCEDTLDPVLLGSFASLFKGLGLSFEVGLQGPLIGAVREPGGEKESSGASEFPKMHNGLGVGSRACRRCTGRWIALEPGFLQLRGDRARGGVLEKLGSCRSISKSQVRMCSERLSYRG